MAQRTKRSKASQRSASGKAQPGRSQPSQSQPSQSQPGQPQPGDLPAGLTRRQSEVKPPTDGAGPAISQAASSYLTQASPTGGSAGATRARPRGGKRSGRSGESLEQVLQTSGATRRASPPDATAQPAAPPTATVPTATRSAATAPADSSDDVPAWAAKVLEEVLTCTYWLDPGETGEPFSATIRFSGRRPDAKGKPKHDETFWQEETVSGIVPGSGPVAVTAEVHGISPGEWAVTVRPTSRGPFQPFPSAEEPSRARRTPWPRRVMIGDTQGATFRTARRPFTKVPGIFRFAYAGLIGIGVLVGLALEALLLKHDHYAALGPVLYSVAGITAGVIGAKAWYVAEQRGRKFDGWCIQGFITGTALVVVAVAFAGAGPPAGAFLGAAASAILLGMAIGRPGCFWAGCCVGRPTTARWGIWSSDRRLGCRRYPAQLLEALASLVIGLGVVSYELVAGLARSGPVAVAGLAAYTLCRQLALSLRAESPHRWRYGRQATMAAAAVAIVVSLVLLAVG
jgi:phosphatidylglycerol---prolipoprotein diacylglyceryl transferase